MKQKTEITGILIDRIRNKNENDERENVCSLSLFLAHLVLLFIFGLSFLITFSIINTYLINSFSFKSLDPFFILHWY